MFTYNKLARFALRVLYVVRYRMSWRLQLAIGLLGFALGLAFTLL
jgi:hypothetical protein